jgi:hypothetical protein
LYRFEWSFVECEVIRGEAKYVVIAYSGEPSEDFLPVTWWTHEDEFVLAVEELAGYLCNTEVEVDPITFGNVALLVHLGHVSTIHQLHGSFEALHHFIDV